ncbi:hypothetical protein CABS01_16782 [Colletotrichum abscissum]|uniref:uncharacterized protein n=1 Tax=Colletotrichum abscissum TaxID=1671311 RepID=UPI0027D53CC4|nr:uncharacterized protein CABS01_16782 [Colletotrichum abscissum]KAK1512600.1 hypothetical protein CABS01_16782 [Colletotrichum abscissum]
MASQPPPGTGLMSVDTADPELGSGTPPKPNPTTRAKRRRDTEAQPTRPSLTGSQLDATNDAPPSAKGPAISTAAAPTGSATGLSNASFDDSRKQIAKEATAYVIQALKRLINHETTPAAARSWAAVAAPMAGNTTAATRSGQSSARPKPPLPAQDRPQAQSKEDLRIFARVPEEGLAAARKIAPFAVRQIVCKASGLGLADLPHAYHIGTGYSLKPLNKQTQERLLASKAKLAECLGAPQVETPIRWHTYVVPRCPTKLHSIGGDVLDPATLVEDEVFAQTGQKPVLVRPSRVGPNPVTNEISWLISFISEVTPFRLFNQSGRSLPVKKRRTLIRHDPGCQGHHSNRFCGRRPICSNCGRPSDSHETGPCMARPQCANCCGPFQASHTDCPARPSVVNGVVSLPGRKERARIRKAGQKVSDTLYKAARSDSSHEAAGVPTPTSQNQQPGAKRARTRTPSASSIVCLGDGSTDSSSMGEDEADEAEDSPHNTHIDRPVLPLPSRSQRAAQKPNYNVANAYTHLELDSET